MKAPIQAMCALLLVMGATARETFGQQTISQYSMWWFGGGQIFDRDLGDLDEAVALTPDQKKAADAILRKATGDAAVLGGDVRRAWMKLFAGFEIPDDPDQMMAKAQEFFGRNASTFTQHQDHLQALERDTMNALMGLLTPEQIAGRGGKEDAGEDRGSGGWGGFETARRVRIDEQPEWLGDCMPLSPLTLVPTLKLQGDDIKAARPIMRRYVKDLDPLLKKKLLFLDEKIKRDRASPAEFMTSGMGTPKDQMHPEIRQLRIQVLGDLERVLSPDMSRRLIAARIGAELRLQLAPPSRGKVVVFCLQELPSVTPQQRDSIENASDAADQRAVEAVRNVLRELDRTAPGDALTWEAQWPIISKLQVVLQRMDAQLTRDVESVLTPVQLEACKLKTVDRKPGKAVLADDESSTPVSSWTKRSD